MKYSSVNTAQVAGKPAGATGILNPISLNIQNSNISAKPKSSKNKENSENTQKPKKKVVVKFKEPETPKASLGKKSVSAEAETSKTHTNEASSKKLVPGSKTVPLYIGDLSKETKGPTLYNVFSKYGSVASVKICCNTATGESLGYGYVNFTDIADAKRAMENLNYTKIQGSEIRIMFSIRDQSKRNNNLGTNVFFSNLPKSLTTRKFYETFSKFGEILSCKISYEKMQGFLLFKTKQAALKVVSDFDNKEFDGCKLFVGLHKAKQEREKEKHTAAKSNEDKKKNNDYKVFVKNLSTDVAETVLTDHFGKFGPLNSIFIKPVTRLEACWALVSFQNKEDSLKAIKELDGLVLKGKKISCTIAKKKESEPKKHNCIILFENLPAEVSDYYLSDICSKFGVVETVAAEFAGRENGTVHRIGYAKLDLQNINDNCTSIAEEIVKKGKADGFSFEATAYKSASDNNFSSLEKSKDGAGHNYQHFPQGLSGEKITLFQGAPLNQFKSEASLNYTKGNYGFARPVMIPLSPFPKTLPPNPYQNYGENGPRFMFPGLVFNKDTAPKPHGYQHTDERILTHLKQIVSHHVSNNAQIHQYPINNVNIISRYILETYWDNDMPTLDKFLKTYDVMDENNNLIKTQVENTLKALNKKKEN